MAVLKCKGKEFFMKHNDFCKVVSDNVTIDYEYITIPILGTTPQKRLNLCECSHSEQCIVSTRDCPMYLKLNNL